MQEGLSEKGMFERVLSVGTEATGPGRQGEREQAQGP